jgi:plasmid stabilization system protein ParE
MKYSVAWSIRAKRSYDNIINYLQKRWTQKEVESFIYRTEEVIRFIQADTFLHQASSKRPNIYRCVMVKQVSLFYKLMDSKVILLLFLG